MATVDYFDSLGTKKDKGALQQNIRIRKYLKNNKGKVTKKHKSSLKKTMAKNTAKRNPIDQVTGQPLAGMETLAAAGARQKYGTTRQSYTDQITTAQQQLSNLDPYFQQYQNHVMAVGQNAADTAAAQAQQLVQGNAQATQQGQAATDAIAARAGSNPQAQEGLQAAQSATAGRAALAANSAAAMTERGNIRKDMAGAQAANSNLAKEETRGKINSNIKKLSTDRNSLDQIIGDYYKGNLDEQRSAFLDNQLKTAALKLQGIKATDQIKNTAADNARADEALNLQKQTAADRKANVEAGLKPDGTPLTQPKGAQPKPKFTQAQKNSTTQSYKGARDTALNWIKSGKLISKSAINKDIKAGIPDANKAKPTVDHYIGVLAKKMGGTKYNALARAAVMDAIYGGVDAATRKRIQQDFGVTLRLSHSAKSKKK